MHLKYIATYLYNKISINNPVSPVFALVVISIVFLTALLLARINPPEEFKKYRSLDGLRGLAAVFVFLHHSAIWFFYKITGIWNVPPSKLYTQFGQGGVVMFFMMSAFLFWGKIREAVNIDWVSLYSSRITRLAPLYYLTMIIALFFVIISPTANIHEIPSIKNILHILLFYGIPDIFGIKNAFVINAGVTWTLPYEWFFYLSLPILYFIIKNTKTIQKQLIGITMLIVFVSLGHFIFHLAFINLSIFIFGILSYEFYRYNGLYNIKKIINSHIGSVIIVGIFILIVSRFDNAYNLSCLFLYFIIFLIISNGNDFFGFFTGSVARKLGDISYGVYLIQGLVLYTFYTYIFKGIQPPLIHWGIDIICGIILVLLAEISYYYFEKKLHDKRDLLAQKIRSFLVYKSST